MLHSEPVESMDLQLVIPMFYQPYSLQVVDID